MSRFTIRFGGCRTRPLASYLKSVGLLRLVSEQLPQADARGFWKCDLFHLNSFLNDDDVTQFLLKDYSPTPLVTPWNGGSGFYPKDQKKGMDAVAGSRAPRFESYRMGIATAKDLVDGRSESPKGADKFAMLKLAKQRWRGVLADWLAAALVLSTDGEPLYPAILGTGGNDGRLDFANNFMQRMAEMFDMNSERGQATLVAMDHLRESLFDDPITGLQSVAIGQFDPGAAGGMNSGNGFATSSAVNLWDFVLMLEGTIAFAPALTRRAHADGLKSAKPSAGLPQAAAPFAVFSTAAGYATAVGDEKSRGEQWMPIWQRPTTYAEFRQMLSQARCRVAGTPAKRPRHVAKAIARAGIARGFSGFERYAFLERNGQANLATPLGRWEVDKPSVKANLLDEIEEWFSRFDRAAALNTAPESWKRGARLIDNAIMNCCRPGATATVWADLAVALGQAEATIVSNPQAAAKSYLRPLYGGNRPLSHGWIPAIEDRSVEVRLAVALASQFGPRKGEHYNLVADLGDPIRQHFIPLETKNGKVLLPPRFAGSNERLHVSNDVVINDSQVDASLAHLVQRRLLMLNRRNDLHHFPLVPTRFFDADVADIAAWIEGRVDAVRMIAISRMLAAVNWDIHWEIRKQIQLALGTPSQSKADVKSLVRCHAGWALTRLCFHWDALQVESVNEAGDKRGSEHRVPCDAAVFANLIAGNGRTAVELAGERLRASGIRAKFGSIIAPPAVVRRWASSIAWSLSQWTMTQIATSVLNLASIQLDVDEAMLTDEDIQTNLSM